MAATPSTRVRPTGILPGVPHPGAIVALAAAVFVATLLAAFSAQARSELGAWWAIAMVFAIGCWLAVAISARVGRAIARLRGLDEDGVPRGASVAWLAGFGCVLLAAAALLLRLSPLGLVLSALPIVLACAYFWSRRAGVDQGAGVVAGVLLFLICLRLFTMSGRPDQSRPRLAGGHKEDVVMLTWNVGGGAPGFSAASERHLERIAKTIKEQGAHIVCLQEIPSSEYLDKLKVELGSGWRGQASSGDGKSTAVLSRIGGIFQASGAEMSHGGPSVVRIASDKGALNFVSCHAGGGRDSDGRRQIVDWVLKNVRSTDSKTVVAGDFNIDPSRGWSFLRPLLTDSPKFDKATWRALNMLGSDPGYGGASTGPLGRRVDWVVVDSKMAVTDYRVVESSRGEGMDHAAVLVRVGLGRAGRKLATPNAIGSPRELMLDQAF